MYHSTGILGSFCPWDTDTFVENDEPLNVVHDVGYSGVDTGAKPLG